MKRRLLNIVMIMLIGCAMLFSGCTQEDEACQYEGVWMIYQMHQDGDELSEVDGGMTIIIDETGHWTITDNGDNATGDIEELNGNDCIYYDEYVYYLSSENGDLIIAFEPKEGSKVTDTGKMFFERIDK